MGGCDLEVLRGAAADLADALCLGAPLGPAMRPARPAAWAQPHEDAGPDLHGRDRDFATFGGGATFELPVTCWLQPVITSLQLRLLGQS